jgi:hypothetical protein
VGPLLGDELGTLIGNELKLLLGEELGVTLGEVGRRLIAPLVGPLVGDRLPVGELAAGMLAGALEGDFVLELPSPTVIWTLPAGLVVGSLAGPLAGD